MLGYITNKCIMRYSEVPKWLDLNTLLLSFKGKSTAEIAVTLFHEGRKAEQFQWPASHPASQKKADFEFVTGKLQHAFSRKEVAKLSPKYGLDESYQSLLQNLIENGEMPEDSLLKLE